MISFASPQEEVREFWDIVLQKYEQLCEACRTHRSQKEISSLTKDFNELLKHPVGRMDDAQKRRFAAIQNRYRGIITVDGGERPAAGGGRVVADTVRHVEHLQIVDTAFVKEILGHVEILQTSMSKDTVVHIIQYQMQEPQKVPETDVAVEEPSPVLIPERNIPETKAPERVIPERKTPERKTKRVVSPLDYLVLLQAAVTPDISYGMMLGVMDSWGGYVKFRSSFSPVSSSYSCLSDGSTHGGYVWTNGSESFSRMTATIGALVNIIPALSAYAGAGYGKADLYWQDTDSNWVRVSDCSTSGLALDLGLVSHIGHLALSLGANWTLPSGKLSSKTGYLDLELGLGLYF